MKKEKILKYISYVMLLAIIIGLCYLIYEKLGKTKIGKGEEDKFKVLSLECNYENTNVCFSLYNNIKIEESIENNKYFLTINDKKQEEYSVKLIDKVYGINSKIAFVTFNEDGNAILKIYNTDGVKLKELSSLDDNYKDMVIDYTNGLTFHDKNLVIYASRVNKENNIDGKSVCDMKNDTVVGGIYEIDFSKNELNPKNTLYNYLGSQIDYYECN